MKRLWLGLFALLLGGVVLLAGRGTAVSAPQVPDAPTLSVNLVSSGFSQPVDITNAGDNRLFVVEQAGRIRILNNGSILATPFLDIASKVKTGSEQGLLGLAFHPDYPDTPYFYVNYSGETDGRTVIVRYTVTNNPNVADPNSELTLLEIDQPYSNHNGGDLNFGPDGYLYIGMGDGGSGGDPRNNAQLLAPDLTDPNRNPLLGKILRIDVDPAAGNVPDCGSGNYSIPADNPFADGPGGNCDEIWAYGLRNPWRFSFDRQTGDMYIGDVGQSNREEIDFQPAASGGGENYGWRCYEGNEPFNTSGCGPASSYVSPIDDYPRSNGADPNDAGTVVTGGYVYRGSQYPALAGYYVYADFGSNNVWLARQNGASWDITPLGSLSGLSNPSTFAEGCDGELYVAGYGGSVFQIQAAGGGGTAVFRPLGTPDQFLYLPLIVNPVNLTCG